MSVKKMSNNTTAETCLNALNETIDCIPLDSSSLLGDIEIILLTLVGLAGIGVWLYKKFLVLNADGKITLDEIIDNVDEVKEKLVEAKAELKTLDETLESRNVTELKAMLKEKGLAVSGKKSDLIARLKASMDE
jgi:Iap family predicted aminopeptidase